MLAAAAVLSAGLHFPDELRWQEIFGSGRTLGRDVARIVRCPKFIGHSAQPRKNTMHDGSAGNFYWNIF